MNVADATAAMEWGECWLDPGPVPPELAAEVKRHTGGIVPGWGTRLASVPWVVRGFVRLNEKRIAHMPTELWDLLALVVSQDNSCRYCYGATRAILKTLGYDDGLIDRLERDIHLTDLSPASQHALQFARKLSQANPRPSAAELDALARAGFTRPAIAEIVATASLNGFHNRISTSFALPPEPFVRWLQHPLMRLVRPLIARQFRGARVAPEMPPPPGEPFGAVIAGLGDTPSAGALRETIDAALASPVLPRATKLLMFAVIGRALGCRLIEADARADLEVDGWSKADLDQVLANLSAPRLDARTAALLPYARDSVRYRTLAFQERTRALGAHATREEIIEGVGVAALANTVARASVLLEAC